MADACIEQGGADDGRCRPSWHGLCPSLVGEGAIICVSDTHPTLTDLLKGSVYMPHDISVAVDWQRVVEDIVKRHDRLDVLVHCAGIEGDSRRGGLATTEDDWNRVIAVNLMGTFSGCKAVLEPMLR